MNRRHAEGRVRVPSAPILCLSYEFPPLGGGGSHVVSGLAHALAADGTHVDLITMGYGDLPKSELADGVTVRRVGRFRSHRHMCSAAEMIPYVITSICHAYRAVKRSRYALNHTHFIFPDGVVAYVLKQVAGLRYVITAHGSDVPNYNPDRFRLLHKVLRPLWMRITSEAECVVCPSGVLQSLVVRTNGLARVTLIPNGIDSTRFSALKPKRNRILLVTRMFRRKGVQHFLRALAEVRPDYDVNIVGDGPYLGKLQTLAQELAIPVKFWGMLDNRSPELKELYETSRIFVLPSNSENFPIVLLEAMTAGLAIITTTGTGCEEVVGDSAILVDAGDTTMLAAKLAELVADPDLCARLGARARQRLCERFDWRRVADQYRRVFDRVAGRRAR